MPLQVREGKNNEGYASLTPLGWCAHGKVYVPQGVRPPTQVESNLFISESEHTTDTSEGLDLLRQIHEEVRLSFKLDTLGVTCAPRQNAQDARAVVQLQQSAELRAGRWHVGLPWKEDHPSMPDSYPSALKRMKGIEKKMTKDSGFAERYRERVAHLLQNDYASELSDTQFIKNLNARRFESTMPEAVDAICNSHYVDDYIDSFADEASAIKMVRNINFIHSAGGFEMRNWTSNSVSVLNSLPNQTLGTAAVRFKDFKVDQQQQGERTLGLIWYPADDKLTFDLSLKRIPESIVNGDERPTKRLMLRVIMSIFDILGFLSPFTIQGRIMLQDTWRLNIDWNDYIPDAIYNKWRKWIDLLKVISDIRIPRCYQSAVRNHSHGDAESPSVRVSETADHRSAASAGTPSATLPLSTYAPGNGAPTSCATKAYESVAGATSATRTAKVGYNNLQLHVFCDSSTRAMCTVAYWRWQINGSIKVAFIASKCKVMPVKPLTVPKAELQAALLAARLANTIGKEHKIVPERRYFWCDSSTVLHWVRNNTRSYKTFEANRLGEIDELSRSRDVIIYVLYLDFGQAGKWTNRSDSEYDSTCEYMSCMTSKKNSKTKDLAQRSDSEEKEVFNEQTGKKQKTPAQKRSAEGDTKASNNKKQKASTSKT
ncbi:uncharacterized protein LOC134805668 [Cydia splendana]|uniref:uncharacterized protein LOC134805668 n=1 Tax=Cydia splendana TaxID=1100963 RepID=UPI00300C702B